MKTQAEVDRIKLGAKIKYRDALVRFQMKHLDFRLLTAEALHGNTQEPELDNIQEAHTAEEEEVEDDFEEGDREQREQQVQL